MRPNSWVLCTAFCCLTEKNFYGIFSQAFSLTWANETSGTHKLWFLGRLLFELLLSYPNMQRTQRLTKQTPFVLLCTLKLMVMLIKEEGGEGRRGGRNPPWHIRGLIKCKVSSDQTWSWGQLQCWSPRKTMALIAKYDWLCGLIYSLAPAKWFLKLCIKAAFASQFITPFSRGTHCNHFLSLQRRRKNVKRNF